MQGAGVSRAAASFRAALKRACARSSLASLCPCAAALRSHSAPARRSIRTPSPLICARPYSCCALASPASAAERNQRAAASSPPSASPYWQATPMPERGVARHALAGEVEPPEARLRRRVPLLRSQSAPSGCRRQVLGVAVLPKRVQLHQRILRKRRARLCVGEIPLRRAGLARRLVVRQPEHCRVARAMHHIHAVVQVVLVKDDVARAHPEELARLGPHRLLQEEPAVKVGRVELGDRGDEGVPIKVRGDSGALGRLIAAQQAVADEASLAAVLGARRLLQPPVQA
eukprot:858186-Prymnesium_polylepis.1